MGTQLDIVSVVRNADEPTIRSRLAELEGERDALRTLLRSIQARNRARPARRITVDPAAPEIYVSAAQRPSTHGGAT